MKIKKKLLWVLVPVVVVAIAAAVVVVKTRSKKKNDGPATVEVKKDNVVEKALAIGKIEPRHIIAVKSKVSGIVERIFADIGDRVDKDVILIEVKPQPTPLELAETERNLELAEVDLEMATKDLERARQLYEQGLQAQEEYDRVQQNYKAAMLRKRMAEERLGLLENGKVTIANREVESVIRAPIDGRILERLVNVGDPVVPLTTYQAGTELMKMADMEELIFKGTVDEIDVGKIHEGMPVEIKIGALPKMELSGKLSKVSPQSRKVENAIVFDVEVSISGDEITTLRSGYSANAEIEIQRRDSVLVIPERVVEFRHDSTFIRIPPAEGEKDAKPVEKYLETGLSDGINIEVLSGLALGDKVLEQPQKEIK